MKVAIIAFLAAMKLCCAGAGETNVFYVTDTSDTGVARPSPLTPQELEAARRAPESRSADADPGGHWGPVTDGFRLSLRLPKTNFTNGEPVTVTLLLRNVTNRLLHFDMARPVPRDPLTRFTLARDGQLLTSKFDPSPTDTWTEKLGKLWRGSSYSAVLAPGTQRRFDYELNALFDLRTNGHYLLSAQRKRLVNLDQSGTLEATSGPAEFTIVSGAAR